MTPDPFATRLAATVDRVRADLHRRGRLRVDVTCELVMPPAFRALLDRVIAEEQADGSGREVALTALYLDVLPTLRVTQALDAGEPIASLFHRPIDWARVPALHGAVARLFAWLARGAIDPVAALDAQDADALFAACPTLDALCARTHYGGFLPLLYAYPGDLARAQTLLDRGQAPEAVIDLLFAAPLVHELCHFRRDRTVELPLYLDECIAALLGVTVLPSTAFPDETGAHGLYAAPLLLQVGQWLARLVGADALLALQSGARPAESVLGGARLASLVDFGWQDYLRRRPPHLLSDNFDPAPWCRVIAGLPSETSWQTLEPSPVADADFAMLTSALQAMCLTEESIGGTFVVRRAPSDAPIVLDLDACVVRGGERLFGRRAEYLLSPPLAAALRRDGRHAITLASLDTDAIPDVVERVRRLVVP